MQPRALLLLLLSFVAVCPLFAQSTGKVQEPLIPDRRPVPDGSGTPPRLASTQKGIPAIAKAANGAVVSIIMYDKDGRPIAQGSGFLVSKDGLVVTNYHVIAKGNSAVVKLPDGALYNVDGVLASDKTRDIALIEAAGTNFGTLILGNSDRVQVGEEVVAIGNPLSLESTVSNGIVSGIRTDEKLGGEFLQVTTPISPGSSGGPLFNMAGEVVGITTLHVEGGENLNFAIPINDAKHLLLAKSARFRICPTNPWRPNRNCPTQLLQGTSALVITTSNFMTLAASSNQSPQPLTGNLRLRRCRQPTMYASMIRSAVLHFSRFAQCRMTRHMRSLIPSGKRSFSKRTGHKIRRRSGNSARPRIR